MLDESGTVSVVVEGANGSELRRVTYVATFENPHLGTEPGRVMPVLRRGEHLFHSIDGRMLVVDLGEGG